MCSVLYANSSLLKGPIFTLSNTCTLRKRFARHSLFGTIDCFPSLFIHNGTSDTKNERSQEQKLRPDTRLFEKLRYRKCWNCPCSESAMRQNIWARFVFDGKEAVDWVVEAHADSDSARRELRLLKRMVCELFKLNS